MELGLEEMNVVGTINDAIENFNKTEIGHQLLEGIHDMANRVEECVAKAIDKDLGSAEIGDTAGMSDAIRGAREFRNSEGKEDEKGVSDTMEAHVWDEKGVSDTMEAHIYDEQGTVEYF